MLAVVAGSVEVLKLFWGGMSGVLKAVAVCVLLDEGWARVWLEGVVDEIYVKVRRWRAQDEWSTGELARD